MNTPPPIPTPPGWGSRYLLLLFLLLSNHLRLIESCPFTGSGGFIEFTRPDNTTHGALVFTGNIAKDTFEVASVDLLELFENVLTVETGETATDTVVTLHASQPGFGSHLDFGNPMLQGRGLEVTFEDGTMDFCTVIIRFEDGNNQHPKFNRSDGGSDPIKFSVKGRSRDPDMALNWELKNVIRVTDFDHTLENADVKIETNNPNIWGLTTLVPGYEELYPNSFVYDVQLFINEAVGVVNGTYTITATDGVNKDDLIMEIEALRENLYAPVFTNRKYHLKLENMPEAGDPVGEGIIEVDDEDGDDLILEVDDEDYLTFNGKELIFTGDADQRQQLKGQTVNVIITATEVGTGEARSTPVMLTIEFPRKKDLIFTQAYYFDDEREECDEIGAGDVILENVIEFHAEPWEDNDIKLRLIRDGRTPDFVGVSSDERTLIFTRPVEEIDLLRLGRNRVMVLNVQAYLERDGAEVTAATTVVVAFPTESCEITTTEETTTEGTTTPEPCECTCPECPTTTEYTETTPPDSTTTPTYSTATPPECPSTPDPPDCPTEPPCDCTTTEPPWWTTGTPPDCPPPIECPTTTPDPTAPTECPPPIECPTTTPDPTAPTECPPPIECPSTTPDPTAPTQCPPPIECPSTTPDPTSTPCDCSGCTTETPIFPPVTECPTTAPCDCPTTPDPGESPEPPQSTTVDPPSTICPECPIVTECPIGTDTPPTTLIITTDPPECPPGCTTPPSSTDPECPPCPTTTRPDPSTCPTAAPCPECPTQPPCQTPTPDPNCPTPPPCPTTTPNPNCPPPPCDCDNCSGENDATCPPCDDDCSTGGLIAATVVTSVLFVAAVGVAGYLFFVLRRAAINPFSLSQATPSAPRGAEANIASSYSAPKSNNAPPLAQPSAFSSSEHQPNRFGNNGTLRSRKLSFGEEPGLSNNTIDSVEPGYSNPTFHPEDSTPIRSSPPEAFSPTAASSSTPSSAMPAPIASSSDPSAGSSTPAPPAPKSIIKPPSEIEPDYEEVPETGAAAATTAAAAAGPGNGEPRSRKVSRVLFAPSDEYISIDEEDNLIKDNKDDESDEEVYERL